MAKLPKLRRYRPGRATVQPFEVDPSAATTPGVVGSPTATEAQPKRAEWFDLFETIPIPAFPGLRWTTLFQLEGQAAPWQRGLVFVGAPVLYTAAGVLVGGPVIPIAAGSFYSWRISINGAPVPGWVDVRYIRGAAGFVSPVPLLEFAHGDRLAVQYSWFDPGATYWGGVLGFRLAGRLVPR